MDQLRLILIYGQVSPAISRKQQLMIDEIWTCGYREYAKQPGGAIIYPRPQDNMKNSWEMSMPNGEGVEEFCRSHPEAVVWSVKKDPVKDRILARIPNFKVYYSACANNRSSKRCNINLVDTPSRMRGSNCALHLKGKDPNFWQPIDRPKVYDYLLMGKRADKNEIFFLKQLSRVKEGRSILWLGGIRHKARARKALASHHSLEITPMYGPDRVRKYIPRAKVGVLYSELAVEGFPQTFLEMTMCGVPVVYGGPQNKFYFFPENSALPKKGGILSAAEKLLTCYDSAACRKRAVENYTIQHSINRIFSLKENAA